MRNMINFKTVSSFSNMTKYLKDAGRALSFASALKMAALGGLALPMINCVTNVDPTVASNTNKLTQTEWLSNSNISINGGAKWDNVNNPPLIGGVANPNAPVMTIPNTYIPHVLDANVLVRVWRLDSSGNRTTESQTLSINPTNLRITDGSSSANKFTLNYAGFTGAGAVYGVQFETYYYNGAAQNHPILMSSFSNKIMNPGAVANKSVNLDVAPLLIADKPTPTSSVTYYLGLKPGFSLPTEVRVVIGQGLATREVRLPTSDVFDTSYGVQTDGTYQYNGASISKVKLSDKMKNYLEGEGSLQLVLSGYSKKVGFLKTDIDSQLSTAFSGGNVSNTSSASSNLNWAGVDNSALWTVTVQTDVNGVQYNEYTIPASTWNTFSTFYSIPLAQLRVLIIRGDGTNDPSTLASTYSGVSGYNPASPLASVAAYEALGYDVPANIVDGSQLASPTTNVATGIGAEIGPAGGTGPTVVRFKVSDTTINGIRQTNEGNIKILVFRAGAANTGSNVFIHSINLSISSGETASFANAVDKYEP